MHTSGGARHPAESGQAHFASHQTKQDFPDKGANRPADLFLRHLLWIFALKSRE
jgi:hypothetical protein